MCSCAHPINNIILRIRTTTTNIPQQEIRQLGWTPCDCDIEGLVGTNVPQYKVNRKYMRHIEGDIQCDKCQQMNNRLLLLTCTFYHNSMWKWYTCITLQWKTKSLCLFSMIYQLCHTFYTLKAFYLLIFNFHSVLESKP